MGLCGRRVAIPDANDWSCVRNITAGPCTDVSDPPLQDALRATNTPCGLRPSLGGMPMPCGLASGEPSPDCQ